MRVPTTFLSPTLLFSVSISAQLLPRQSSNPEQAYLDSVCSPATPSGAPLPPCLEIDYIQTTCEPNGTSPLDYLAHAECMCGGSFFADWIGCLNCLYIHGGRSKNVANAFSTIISSASDVLCTGTPTAPFASIFSSLSDAVAPTGTDTATVDQFRSNPAVSLYYTATGSEGPGRITGSATAATAQSTAQSTVASGGESSAAPASTPASSSSAAGPSGSGAGVASTSHSTGGAAPTGLIGGIFGAVVAGAVMVAL
ncbi:hypothetical protein F5884DRAFT_89223 [Xylogone sp. PMI_703]|nr:hypothetical protein F5884DRAFT_89223 [Xylogone sp. PMI_703]